ncbi:MAG: 3-isopropylmalate dehydratase small subunit [Thermoleophilia bacterium]
MIEGAAWILGDNVSTDEILPGRYMGLTDLAALARHALEGIAPGLPARIAPGDVLVGGRNFGTGSSREQAPVALREAGFGAIVAVSFARIFFRNCLNVGLPVLWSAAEAREGDRLQIDPGSGTIRNMTRGTEHVVAPLPAFAQAIVAGGGLMPYARGRLGRTLVPRAGES